ncbi:unnamed protein product [Trichobilharzia regenti]|nr:unnamed protein product [Trichobilharzia regenti]
MNIHAPQVSLKEGYVPKSKPKKRIGKVISATSGGNDEQQTTLSVPQSKISSHQSRQSASKSPLPEVRQNADVQETSRQRLTKSTPPKDNPPSEPVVCLFIIIIYINFVYISFVHVNIFY